MTASLTANAADRKAAPMAEGLLWYFPNALAAVAAVSKRGNDQHNPGQPMHHARGKSTDHADCIMRHLVDAGTLDSDGLRHSAKVAWRALALLQEEIERADGVPIPRNAKVDAPTAKTLYDEQSARDAEWNARDGLPAETAYLASFAPNEGARIATTAEIDGLRDMLSKEELRGFGIGDVAKAWRAVTNAATSQHPMAAEALREEFAKGDQETGV